MKTAVDTPDVILEEVLRLTGARTRREALVAAISDFNRRRRMAALVELAGACPNLMTVDELRAERRARAPSVGTG